MCRNTQMEYPITAHLAICGSLVITDVEFISYRLTYLRKILFQLVSNFDGIFLRDMM